MTERPRSDVAILTWSSSSGATAESADERVSFVAIGICTPASMPSANGFHIQRKPIRGFTNQVAMSTDSRYEPRFAADNVAPAESS